MPIAERLKPSFISDRRPASERIAGARKRLIVALDVPSAKAAEDLANRLEGVCQWFKVGMELFTAAGPPVVERLVARGHSVFLDLKFHDIPNTVAGAVRSAARFRRANGECPRQWRSGDAGGVARGVGGIANPPELLAVTVLTSMDAAQLKASGVGRSPESQVQLLAKMSLKAGIRGFVCSPQEVAALRALTGPEGVLVVPGIRPAGAAADDQKRLATPADSLRNGASYLVVGRPITQAPDPAEAAEAIVREMAEIEASSLARRAYAKAFPAYSSGRIGVTSGLRA